MVIFNHENLQHLFVIPFPVTGSTFMLLGKYSFYGVFEAAAVLPAFKGSTFRGVFGVALKKVVCALRQQECAACLLRGQCIYARIFEAPSGPGAGQPSPPHPFVIEPPLTEKSQFQPGDRFEFDLLLFGWANEYLPYFVYAFEEMGKIGLGRRLDGKRGSFKLERITVDEKIIYQSQDGLLIKHPPQVLELPESGPDQGTEQTLTVHLQTPLRLKFQNTLQAQLPFHVLMRAVLRRIASLNTHFGIGEPPLDYRGLIARAQKIEIIRADLHWHDWKRYSNRQDQAMLMGGMTGSITYGGRLAEFQPLLAYAEKVHLGKGTTFGLGKIRVKQDMV